MKLGHAALCGSGNQGTSGTEMIDSGDSEASQEYHKISVAKQRHQLNKELSFTWWQLHMPCYSTHSLHSNSYAVFAGTSGGNII